MSATTGNGSADATQRTSAQILSPNLIASEVDGGRIADNILQFARLLRAAGLPVGPEKTLRATEAVLAVGLESPKTLYWTLHAVFVNRRQEREIFNQAFLLFWRDPGYLQQMMSLLLPRAPGEPAAEDKSLSRRMSESLLRSRPDNAPREDDRLELEAHETWSDRELLRSKDFEQMSAAELAAAKRAIARMRLPLEEIATRRFEPAGAGGSVDMRRVLRETAAKGSDHMLPRFRRRRLRRPPLVLLCDISGSMDGYARIFLHFLYAVTNDRDRVHAFLFGTRLSNVTRTLRMRDPDVAIAKVTKDVQDWSGGTRIGHCIEEFNHRWARRVLGQNALVLLFTDGLDRESGDGLSQAMRRLAASCRKLVWLNPLLRYGAYQPLAAGARAIAEHAHELRGCHSLQSLEDLVAALSAHGPASLLPPE
jgi:hypothetical protein